MIRQISKQQARRFLLHRQGLLGQTPFIGKEGIVQFVRKSGCLQFDPIDICGKSPELSLFSRVEGFQKNMLDQLLYEDRRLIDYFDKNLAIIPTEDWPCFERTRNRYRTRVRSEEQIEKVAEKIREELRVKGPLSSNEVEQKGKVDWYWSKTSLARAALETLYFRGELIVHHKQGTVKSYDFAEHHLPKRLLQQADPNVTEEQYHAWGVLRRIGAVGFLWKKASDAWLGLVGFKAAQREAAFRQLEAAGQITALEIEGVRDKVYCLSKELPLLEEAKERSCPDMLRFLAPLDCFLWDRKLIQAIFGYSYTWEIYKKPEQREFGYYVLPILYGEQFVGRIEPVCRRKQGFMEVKGLWWEPDVVVHADLKQALRSELQRLAEWNQCKWLDTL